MSYTVGQIIDSARELLNDADADSYRYTEDVMYQALNKAFTEARRARADLFLRTDGVVTRYDPALPTAVFPFGDQYVAPVVEYVAGYAELRDDEYTVDGRAIALLSAFTKAMTGG